VHALLVVCLPNLLQYVSITPCLRNMDLPSLCLQWGSSMSVTDGVSRRDEGWNFKRLSLFYSWSHFQRNTGVQIV